MICTQCNLRSAIGFCDECADPTCEVCSATCDMCGKTVCRNHYAATPHGRKLCGDCFAKRNLIFELKQQKREARRHKKHRKGAEAAGAPPAAYGDFVPGPASDTGDFVPIQGDTGDFVAAESPEYADFAPAAGPDELGSLSFEALMADRRPAAPSSTKKAEKRDEERPILRASSYKPPSRTAYVAAFLFFGLAGLFFYARSPMLRDVMWPFESAGIEYTEDLVPTIADTNQLRNTSNISNLNVLIVVPLFVLTWGFVLAYLYGVFVVLRSAGPAVYYYVKRRGWDKRRTAPS